MAKKESDFDFELPSPGNRPKAVLKKPVTKEGAKPFIAQNGGVMQGSGIIKGGSMGLGQLEYGVGDRVRHIKYGEGNVTEIEKAPRDYQVKVRFDEFGDKVMYAAFAKLQKL